MPCEDVPANRSTTETYTIGEHYDGEFHVCPGVDGPDIDWIKVNLIYGNSYVFRMSVFGSTDGEPATLELYDHHGIADNRFDRSGDSFFEFTARRSGEFYLVANQGEIPDETHFEIFSFPFFNETRGRLGNTIHTVGYRNSDKFENPSDVDVFDVKLYQGRQYHFLMNASEFNGSPLTAAFVELKNADGLTQAKSAVAGSNGKTKLTFTPSETGDYTLEFFGGNNGQFTVDSWLTDEAGTGRGTQRQLSFVGDIASTGKAMIGAPNDIDWYKVDFRKNDIVRVTLSGSGTDYLETPTLILRGPNGDTIGTEVMGLPAADVESSSLMSYFQIQESGTYYAIARSNDVTRVGGYQLDIEKVRTPLDPNVLFGRGDNRRLVIAPGQNEINLSELVDDHGVPAKWYEVFSGVPLTQNGQRRGTHLYAIRGEELNQWSVSGDFEGLEDLFIRGYAAREWSEWIKFPVIGKQGFEDLDSGKHWNGNTITYRFVPQLPDYYSNDPPEGFAPLNSHSGAGKRVVDALNSFASAAELDVSIQEIHNGDADINIFMSTSVPGWTTSYWPAPGRGGDLILNADIYATVAPFAGTRNYYEILRGVGKVLGLSPVNMTREDTVMGNQGYYQSGPFPEGPGVYDIMQLANIYESSLFNPAAENDSQDFTVIDGQSRITTIGSESRGISVDPSVAAGGVYIDLRGGQKSYVIDENVTASEVFVGVGAHVYQARGSIGNDTLYGNGSGNILNGGQGDDFLIGLGGDDEKYGGIGNDIYIHYFGDGNDVIFDLDGRDTLCFFGRDDFHVDQLQDDYLFTRQTNYLQIDLTLDGGLDEGSVKIYTGQNSGNLVESLELWHGTSNSERISLFNIYNQMGVGESKRFRVTEQQDSFGSLVAPV